MMKNSHSSTVKVRDKKNPGSAPLSLSVSDFVVCGKPFFVYVCVILVTNKQTTQRKRTSLVEVIAER